MTSVAYSVEHRARIYVKVGRGSLRTLRIPMHTYQRQGRDPEAVVMDRDRNQNQGNEWENVSRL